MLIFDKQQFTLAREAKLGREALSPELAELRNWITQEFEVRVIHIVLDHFEFGPPAGTPRLTVILESDADYDSWKSDATTIRKDIQRRVLSKFRKLIGGLPEIQNADKSRLFVDNFSAECLAQACSRFRETHAKRIVGEFDDVPISLIDGWSRSLVVFLPTEHDVVRCTNDGTCQKIAKQCFDAVKEFDEFDYLNESTFRLKFDSIENLNANYEGSLFYYWR